MDWQEALMLLPRMGVSKQLKIKAKTCHLINASTLGNYVCLPTGPRRIRRRILKRRTGYLLLDFSYFLISPILTERVIRVVNSR